MPIIPIFEVYDAWDSINEYCEFLTPQFEAKLLVLAKINIEKFQWAKRDVDFGESTNNFPLDNTEYDKKILEEIYHKIKKICSFCEGYHNERCYISNTRESIETLLFGKAFPLKMDTFCEYLKNKKIVTALQIQEAYIIQKMTNPNIGAMCITLQKLKPGQVVDILKAQKFLPKKFGHIAIEKGFLTAEEVSEITKLQTNNYIFIGDILVALDYITEEVKENSLRKYLKEKTT